MDFKNYDISTELHDSLYRLCLFRDRGFPFFDDLLSTPSQGSRCGGTSGTPASPPEASFLELITPDGSSTTIDALVYTVNKYLKVALHFKRSYILSTSFSAPDME